MTTTDHKMTTASRGERKLAVLLFADLSGYTRLCRTLDPEDVAATVLPLLADVRAAVTAEGGTATGVAGDGFLAVFGAPVAHVDIADRAVRAAVEMRRVVHARSIELSSMPIPDIHIGITAGEVLAYPSDDPSGLSFIGPAINLAARLSDAATAGTILIDDNVRRLLSEPVDVGASRDLIVQGHEEGVQAWEVLGTAPVATVPADLPFVGREQFLRRLDSAWEISQLNELARLIRLVGEAGIGKSTIARHWLRRRRGAVHVWINCLDVPFGEHVNELLRQLRSLSGVATPEPPEPKLSTVGAYAPSPKEDVAVRAREVVRLLHHVGRDGIAIVLDDFQHADDELRGVIDALLTARMPLPVVILCPCRVEELDDVRDSNRFAVPPLDDASVAALVTATLGAPPPDDVVEALLRRAEGRPLAALQSSAYLVETGTVAVQDDKCVVIQPQQLSDLPDTMRLFVAGRLDRLPPAEKQFIQELSAVGTNVGVELIERLFGTEAQTLLNSLVARGFLVRTETRVGFSHGVVHEVAYASLPRAVRARLHRRMVEENPDVDEATRALHARRWAASAVESSPVDRRQAVSAALRYTCRHARTLYSAHVRNAYAEARTVRLLLEDEARNAPSEAAQLLVLIANCDIHGGRYDDALAGATRAIQICQEAATDPALLVAALCAQGEALSQLRHYQSARQSLDEAGRVAAEAGDDVGRGRALRLLGDTYRHSDSLTLLELTEEAFDILAASGDDQGAAEAARTMAYWLSVSTTPRLQRWIDEAEQRTPTEDVRGRVELARTHGYAAAARLDFGTAREQARLCRDLGNELGIGDVTVDGLIIGIESAAALGLLNESIALLSELEGIGNRRAEPRVRHMAAVIGLQPLQRAGALERAREAIAQATAMRDAFGPPETMMAAAATGLAARDRGSWAEAMEHLEVALGASDAAGFALTSLVLRLELVVCSALRGAPSPDAAEVGELAQTGGAPAIASMARAAMELCAASPSTFETAATVQEAAIRADACALHLERRGEHATAAWVDAAAQWARLGQTVFLARAQARAGDRAAAEQTLDAIGAEDEGRAWSLEGAALQR